jgi:hypothetical protein
MLYRVAWRPQHCPIWQWKSTTLHSLAAVSGYLRLYSSFPQSRLRVLKGRSRQELEAALARENAQPAHARSSVAADGRAADDGQPDWSRGEVTPDGIRAYPCGQQPVAAAVAVVVERRPGEPAVAPGGDAALEGRRVLLEQGAGGDYDEPYTFALPVSVKQTLAWARLLARLRSGTLEP